MDKKVYISIQYVVKINSQIKMYEVHSENI